MKGEETIYEIQQTPPGSATRSLMYGPPIAPHEAASRRRLFLSILQKFVKCGLYLALRVISRTTKERAQNLCQQVLVRCCTFLVSSPSRPEYDLETSIAFIAQRGCVVFMCSRRPRI